MYAVRELIQMVNSFSSRSICLTLYPSALQAIETLYEQGNTLVVAVVTYAFRKVQNDPQRSMMNTLEVFAPVSGANCRFFAVCKLDNNHFEVEFLSEL